MMQSVRLFMVVNSRQNSLPMFPLHKTAPCAQAFSISSSFREFQPADHTAHRSAPFSLIQMRRLQNERYPPSSIDKRSNMNR